MGNVTTFIKGKPLIGGGWREYTQVCHTTVLSPVWLGLGK